LQTVTEYFDTRRELVDAHLRRIARETLAPPPLREPIEQAMRSPGKRIRGILTLAVGETWRIPPGRLVDAAAAFEMIHLASLVLDDLPAMDDAALRRGAPTIHRRFGEDIAILTAVGLLNDAYRYLVRAHSALAPRRWPLDSLVERTVSAVGWDGAIGGEAVDLHSEGVRLDFETLEYIHSRKTGSLFVAAAAGGAMLANAPAAGVAAVEAYAKNLGLAFQIVDDILDVTATAEALGKDVGKDAGKLTFVRLAGVEGARQLADELVGSALAAVVPLGAGAAPLRDLATLVTDRLR
jgi:geranylgeranyl diphosphate synthase, type II